MNLQVKFRDTSVLLLLLPYGEDWEMHTTLENGTTQVHFLLRHYVVRNFPLKVSFTRPRYRSPFRFCPTR